MTIEASHYEETVQLLMKDPVIIGMAEEIPTHFDPQPWYFMTRALQTYTERGGQIPTHIGGPAEAVRRLVQAR